MSWERTVEADVYLAEACGNTFAVIMDEHGHADRMLTGLRQRGQWSFDSALVMRPTVGASVAMSIHERDGSVSVMCGNGLRVLGAILDDLGLQRSVRVHSGVRAVERSSTGAYQALLRPAVLRGMLKRPVGPSGGFFLYEVEGEPHAVALVKDAHRIPLQEWGSYVVPLANCTVASVLAPGILRVRTYERGVNRETISCGTGACAAATAAVHQLGLTARRIRVRMSSFVLVVNLCDTHMVLEGSVNIHWRKKSCTKKTSRS